MIFHRLVRKVTLLSMLLPAGVLARDISVNTDMFRNVEPPTPAHPTFYFPVVLGYLQMGDTIPGEQIPVEKDVIHKLATTLAAQGYVASRRLPPPPAPPGGKAEETSSIKLTPPPSLILVFFWGSMNPSTVDDPAGSSTAGTTSTINRDRMIALVAGKGMDNLAYSLGTDSLKFEGLFQSIEHDNRYFIIITAYDYNAWMERHKKVHLWTSRMSIPSLGMLLPQVVSPLISAGGPYIGRETKVPVEISTAAPAGQVEVGQPVVVPSGSSAPAPSGR